MRIALCADGSSPHGQRWANGLVDRGHSVAFVWMEEELAGADLSAFRPGIAHHAYALPSLRSSPFRWPGSLLAPRRLAGQIDPDLVHGINLLGHAWTAHGFGRRPLVLTALGSDVSWLGAAPAGVDRVRSAYAVRRTRAAVRAADVVFADSRPVAERIREAVPGARTSIVRFGVELRWPSGDAREAWRNRLGIDQGAFVLLSSRLVVPRYRIDEIIRALPAVLHAAPSAVLVLKEFPRFSDLDYRRHCLDLAGELGVDGALRLVGELDRSDLLDLFAAADVYVSVPERDATAVSVFEAMAARVAVIATDAPGIDPDILEDRRTALLVPVGDPVALAAAAVELAHDTGLRASLVGHAAEVVTLQGDFERELDRATAIYAELAAARPR